MFYSLQETTDVRSRLLCHAKPSTTTDGENKTFFAINTFKQYLPTSPTLDMALERKLQPKKVHCIQENKMYK